MKKLFIALAAVTLTACVKSSREKQSRSTHGKAKVGIPPSKPYRRTLVNGMPTE